MIAETVNVCFVMEAPAKYLTGAGDVADLRVLVRCAEIQAVGQIVEEFQPRRLAVAQPESA